MSAVGELPAGQIRKAASFGCIHPARQTVMRRTQSTYLLPVHLPANLTFTVMESAEHEALFEGNFKLAVVIWK